MRNITILFLLWTINTISQTIYLEENFEYSSGIPLTNHGWFAHSAANTNPILVHNVGLSFSITDYLGNNHGLAAAVTNTGQDINRPLSQSVSNGIVYTSFLMKVNAEFVETGQGFFIHYGTYSNVQNPVFTNLSSAFRGRTFVRLGTNPSAQFKLGLSFNANEPQGETTDLNIGQTYLVVLKYEFVDGELNDKVSLFVFVDGDNIISEPNNPTIGPLTSTLINPLDENSGLAADAPALQAIALRQYNANQKVIVDGLYSRVTWNLTDPDCTTSLGVDSTTCDSLTSGNDTYTASITYSNASATTSCVVTASAGTIGGDDPNITANGTITISGISEGTDVTINIEYEAIGGLCTLERVIQSPVCEPDPVFDFLIENFNYSASQALTANNWTAHSSLGTNPILVSESGLSFASTNYIGSGIGNAALLTNTGEDLNRPFTESANSGSVYASFLMKVNAPFSASGVGFFFHYGYYSDVNSPVYTALNTAFRARTHVAMGTDANTQFKLGLSFNANAPTATTDNLNIGETYLVVVKYKFIDGATNDEVSLFVFADGTDISVEPATPTIGPFTGTQADAPVLQTVALRQFNADQKVTLDGLYVRSAWDLSGNFSPTIWNGTAWNNVDGPTINDDAIIDGELTLNDNLSAKNLTVTTNGSLVLNSSNSITLSGTLTNEAEDDAVVIESGAYLIQNTTATNTGNITVKRNALMKRLDIVLWSSPVAAQNLLGLSPNTLTNRFFTFSETANAWSIVADVTNHTMAVGTGYGVRAPNDHPTSNTNFTGIFKGVPNNGDYATAFTSEHATAKYNVIGNPYPSVLDLRAFYAGNNTKINNTFYFYEHTLVPGAVSSGQSNYGTFTIGATADDNNYVPATSSFNVPNPTAITDFEAAEAAEVGQGFFVKALTGQSGFLNFDNTMRKTTTSGLFFRNNMAETEANQSSKFRLEMNSPEGFNNQTVVGYYDYSNDGIDMMDAQGIGSPLYTLLDTQKLVIQGFGLPFNQGQVIPLGANFVSEGTYSIGLHSAQGIFENEQYVLLHDTTLGVYHNLTLAPYEFEANGGVNETRFQIVFSSILSNENPAMNNNEVIVYELNEKLVVQIKGNSLLNSIEIVDLTGRKLFERNNLNQSILTLEKFQKTETVLLVNTKTIDGKTQTHKVFY